MEVQHNSELRYQGIVDRCPASIIDSPFHRIPCLGDRIRVRELDHNRRVCNGYLPISVGSICEMLYFLTFIDPYLDVSEKNLVRI